MILKHTKANKRAAHVMMHIYDLKNAKQEEKNEINSCQRLGMGEENL